MHMPSDDVLVRGTSIELDIPLDPVTHAGAIDVGFTRNFASSQAFESLKISKGITTDVIPPDPEKGLSSGPQKHALVPTGVYDWLGFEAYALLRAFLDDARTDPTLEIDALIYDFNEPDLLEALEALGPRLRAIVDDSSQKDKQNKEVGHLAPGSPESKAAARLRKSAGKSRVKRGHFKNLQHNKVLIAKRGGVPFRVIAGSTNFTFRGLYIQANNMIVFGIPEVAALFEQMFEQAFDHMDDFAKHDLAKKWHVVTPAEAPAVHVCFAPHTKTALSLAPAGAAIDAATSSAFYSFAFMNQTKSGAVREALDRLIHRPLFSYGVVNKKKGMEIFKPDGKRGLVDFAYLAKHAPEPFSTEWSGGQGINVHHKFLVTDFDKPTAKVFTGSSNFAPSGEGGNGDHMLLIEDQKIAIAYTIEALRMFDHLHFRNVMQEAEESERPKKLFLRKPPAITGAQEAWFAPYYIAGSQKARDRKLFAGS
jgi:phosphatidylserine/phosphatidylglycerophosphate/cardiolipin synthase-like enzyme